MTDLANYRSYIRDHLDLSPEELPNVLVDSFLRDASTQIDAFARDWVFQANVWELQLVAGQHIYTADDMVDTSDFGTFELQKIARIYDHEDNVLPYVNKGKTRASTVQAGPQSWSRWGERITIRPRPDQSYTLEVYGFRKVFDWIGDDPDGTEQSPFPSEFDEPLRQWALGRAYAQQEEGATATSYYDLCNYNLSILGRRYQSIDPIEDLRMLMGDTVGE